MSNRRKTKLVNISIQRAMTLRIVTHSILFVWSVFLVCLGMMYMLGPVENSENMEQIRSICLKAIGISSLVILPAIVYDSIKFGHRMVGPIVKFKNLLPRVGLEHVDHVGLRANDYWQDLPAEFNAMLDRVEELRRAAAVNNQHGLAVANEFQAAV